MSVPEELIQCVQQTALTAQQAHDEKVFALLLCYHHLA